MYRNFILVAALALTCCKGTEPAKNEKEFKPAFTFITRDVDSMTEDEKRRLMPPGDTQYLNVNGREIMTVRTSSCTNPKK